ncbi:ABC transporter ATP-binding protein [Mesorhizobium sp.]|uniref:ABC transporter ATP-binding protein n=1 Tax=Mesorhizobium sp. TaxID=1871066 RepID=UPI000FE7ACAF|nr:ABC transporter ATP-binding protein [Mesorhizobium sp.]RWB42884.1 MAG: ABC transporter ATP-binding protein [Mesorhizobium sp.]RWB64887.1 MAG: ABC transporter ATP-binding protein [Mesorhizobium sp.]RWB88153.1 MAG: ABC transporter ATP-binding protein [Mesorhizobium sp.]RWC16716.1 MAG: ABC transporter ATP-binding protein [Mesorhizobium sp.]RWD77311.1 MAG: ABC transporter ATP-binding protein [Mesorhizobium sp.]
MAEMLRLLNVSIRYGGLQALSDISMEVDAGTIHSVIGPNGAGKTTLFNAITGVARLSSGTIQLDGSRIDGQPPHVIARQGIARTFQNVRLFGSVSVLDNVLIAEEARPGVVRGLLPTLLCLPSALGAERTAREEALRLLDAVGIAPHAQRLARTLSYGDQRRLEIARALATRPKLLLLDEPAAGMNPQETSRLSDFIAELPSKFGVGILLIEHQMRLVMDISNYVTVLEYGRKIVSGEPSEVRQNPEVLRAYLGGRTAERALGTGTHA